MNSSKKENSLRAKLSAVISCYPSETGAENSPEHQEKVNECWRIFSSVWILRAFLGSYSIVKA